MECRQEPEPLINARDVAAWLGLAVSTVYEKAASGELPHVRLWSGSRKPLIRFRRTEIETWLIDRRRGPGGPAR